MDNKLPPRPSLEQLRKQAKELKDSGQHLTLSDAQFALARQYGFSSWPNLKTAVELDTLSRYMAERNYEAIRKLLAESPNLVREPVEDGSYPLHFAAELDDPQLVQILIEAGAPLDQKWDNSGHTPLSWAVTYGSQQAALKFIELGDAPDLFTAAGMGLIDQVRRFWSSGKLEGLPSTTGSSRFTESGEALPRPPVDPVDQVSDALYISSRNGHLDVAKFLLDKGADPNWRGYCGANCLAWAEFTGNLELCDLLLEKGADPHMRDFNYQAEPKLFALMAFATWGFPVDQLRQRLSQSPEMVNVRGGFGTLLNAAVWNNQVEAAKVLLEFGADREAKNAAGLTALELAKERGNAALVELLSA